MPIGNLKAKVGQLIFCLDAGIPFEEGAVITTNTEGSLYDSLEDPQKEFIDKFSQIGSFMYYNSNPAVDRDDVLGDLNYAFVTQMAIWDHIHKLDSKSFNQLQENKYYKEVSAAYKSWDYKVEGFSKLSALAPTHTLTWNEDKLRYETIVSSDNLMFQYGYMHPLATIYYDNSTGHIDEIGEYIFDEIDSNGYKFDVVGVDLIVYTEKYLDPITVRGYSNVYKKLDRELVYINDGQPMVSGNDYEYKRYFKLEVEPMGYIEIDKDAENGITNNNSLSDYKGAKFEIVDKNGNVVETLTTDSKGYAKSKRLRVEEYTVREVSTPNHFIEPRSQVVSVKENRTVKVSFDNKYKTGSLTVTKTGETLNDQYNGYLPLKDVGFKLVQYDGSGNQKWSSNIVKTDNNGR